MTDTESSARINRLLDAIDLVKTDQREEAVRILRELIREDSDFEEAWLWMSLAVDSLDQSILCLENVLKINPDNTRAAGALYRLRETEVEQEKYRAKLRFYRDMSMVSIWILVLALLFGVFMTFYYIQTNLSG